MSLPAWRAMDQEGGRMGGKERTRNTVAIYRSFLYVMCIYTEWRERKNKREREKDIWRKERP